MGRIYFVQEQNRGHHMPLFILNILMYTYLKACSSRNILVDLVASGCLQEGELGDRDQGQERNLIFLPPEAPCDAPSIIWVWEAIMVVFWED